MTGLTIAAVAWQREEFDKAEELLIDLIRSDEQLEAELDEAFETFKNDPLPAENTLIVEMLMSYYIQVKHKVFTFQNAKQLR